MEAVKKGTYQNDQICRSSKRSWTRWTKVAGEPLWKEWVKKMEGKGRPEAQQILNATLELLKSN